MAQNPRLAKVKDIAEKIERRYDAENDAGNISWVDIDLKNAVVMLVSVCQDLSARVEELELRSAARAQLEEELLLSQ